MVKLKKGSRHRLVGGPMVEVVGDHGDGLVTVSIAGRYQVVRRSSLK